MGGSFDVFEVWLYEFRHNPVGAGAFDSPEGLELDFASVKRDVVSAVPYKLFCKKIELHLTRPRRFRRRFARRFFVRVILSEAEIRA